MVLLSLALLLGAPALAQDDSRLAVAVLPPLEQAGVSAKERAALERALQGAVLEMSGFREATLSMEDRAELLRDADCRAEVVCLERHVPRETELIVDPSLSRQGEALVLELRLRKPDGTLSRRRSWAIAPGSLTTRAEEELQPLLAGWSIEARLYAQAVAGDKAAATQLQRRFPDGGYARALE